MKYWTNYPFTALGDKPGVFAPIRECTLIGYDTNKLALILVDKRYAMIKAGYIYTSEHMTGCLRLV